jgi:hypothetical protein
VANTLKNKLTDGLNAVADTLATLDAAGTDIWREPRRYL